MFNSKLSKESINVKNQNLKKVNSYKNLFNSINIYTSRNPHMFDKLSFSPSSRYDEHLLTIDELIVNNLKTKEIETIKKEQEYFGINSDLFKKVKIFEKRTLTDILKYEEEKGDMIKSIKNDINKNRKKICFK